jgi:hypothetical protein
VPAITLLTRLSSLDGPRSRRPDYRRRCKIHHFVDKLSLADVHASLERAADVLSTVKGSALKMRPPMPPDEIRFVA